jgi:hypothetical protein
MSQTTQKKPVGFSTTTSRLNDLLDEIRDQWGEVTVLVESLESARDETADKVGHLADKLCAAEKRYERLEDAPWSLDVSNDGTFILTHGEVECPQYVINELLAAVQPAIPAWME